MFIWRKDYENLLREIATAQRLAAQYKAEADGATRFLMSVEESLRHEKARADNAVDELLKIKIGAPVSPGQRVDPTQMDNVFEDEDQDAVKRLRERMLTEGPDAVYAEAIEELHGYE